MNRIVLALLAVGLAVFSACGPLDDGGGGFVGAACTVPSDCSANDCCGNGTGAVGVAQQPSCPASCTNGREPHSPCVNGGSGIVTCDSSNHCSVATGAPGSCTN